ncbi:uncharacterized protein LOC143143273 [Ptiloglossa arizonensis]|uniref:uncharacterized protein LOC143143273 n=1 Tax=Ptiloglossa arizonensis TaxID=3350558 RepID=UPI003F9FF60E
METAEKLDTEIHRGGEYEDQGILLDFIQLATKITYQIVNCREEISWLTNGRRSKSILNRFSFFWEGRAVLQKRIKRGTRCFGDGAQSIFSFWKRCASIAKSKR